MSNLRVALLADLNEDGWPSLDPAGDMLAAELGRLSGVSPRLIRPLMRRRFSRFRRRPLGPAWTVDRALGRLWDYPRALRGLPLRFDTFHILHHSYASVVGRLPAEHTVVTCHDLEAFGCFLDEDPEPRSAPFKALVACVLRGISAAGRVVVPSACLRDELLEYGISDEDRVRVVPPGVHPAFVSHPDPEFDGEAERLLGPPQADVPILLNVGSAASRKRVDLLLKVFASVRTAYPRARLVRLGGGLTATQRRLAAELELDAAILSLPFLDRRLLAAVYRRADLLLQTSIRESFCLPPLEALACGTPIVVSDLPVFREIVDLDAELAAPEDVDDWVRIVVRLLRERDHSPDRWLARRVQGEEHAAKFSWSIAAKRMLEVYLELEPSGREAEVVEAEVWDPGSATYAGVWKSPPGLIEDPSPSIPALTA